VSAIVTPSGGEPGTAGSSPARREQAFPRLHVVTDDSMLARGGWDARAAAVLEAGGSGVCLHLRGPTTEGATLHRLASELLPIARKVGALLFANDRVDVALAAGLDGVHLGARSLPVGTVRGLLPEGRWLGASCHDATEASTARHEGADYAFLGTIFPTPTHPGVAGMGPEGVAATVSGLGGFPIIGIGGIDPARAADVLEAGAHGIAVVRGVWDARDAASAVQRYLEAIDMRARRQ
jgi:thiamine-phosphate diphosphorylase